VGNAAAGGCPAAVGNAAAGGSPAGVGNAAAGGSPAAGGGGIDGDGGGAAAAASPSVPCRTSRLGVSDINSEKYASCITVCSATPSRTRWIFDFGLSA